MTPLEVSLCFVQFSCTVVGEAQVRADGKDKLAIVKEDLKRFSFLFLPCFSGAWALLYVFVWMM